MRSTDVKLLRKIKGNSISNCDFLQFTIPVSGGLSYCLPWMSINPATPLNIPHKSVNINTHKTLSMQQQLHFTPDQLLQLYIARWLLYIYICIYIYIYIVCCNINAVCTLYTHCTLCLVPATQCNSRTVQTAVCVVWRLICSTESYKMDCSLVRILRGSGKANS